MEIILFALVGWLVGMLVNRTADWLLCERCPDYRKALPWRALLVQCASAAALAFLWTRYGTSVMLLLAGIYTAVFLLVLVTDLERRLIFNAVILPAIFFAALASPFAGLRAPLALLGGGVALVVFIAIYLFGRVFERVRGLRIRGGAFGQGDVTLAAFIGLVTGFPAVINALLFGIILGGVGAILTLLYHALVHRRLAFNAVIPYGPFLCIAGWLSMALR